MTKIKICGLTRLCDIEAVNLALPDYVGFVFAKSRRQVSAAHALAMREKLHPSIVPVGVFVNEKPENIISLADSGIIDAIQLHGDEDERFLEKIKALTGRTVLKAVSIQKAGDAQKWQNSCADYLLLDKCGGGTGQCFDWNMIGRVDKPFFLAGGINFENVRDAIEQVNPFAVDISSGAELDGVKENGKIQMILRRVKDE